MGRKARQREEELLAHDQKISDELRSHRSQTKKRPEALTWQKVVFDVVQSNEQYWVNDPSTWVNTRKTKNIDTLRLDMIRHVFGIYSCPSFLETVCLPQQETSRDVYGRDRDVKEKQNIHVQYVPWYLTVAQGGSLYKSCSKGVLSKKETHAFLHAPKQYTIKQNIWWARAFCESNNNLGVANRIAQSNIVARVLTDEFWISVMRFFVRYPTNLSEMNDLMDFFVFMRQENGNYSLKSRSLEAVQINCEEWHRFLNKQRSIGGGNWPGVPIEDWRYKQGKNKNVVHWTMTQIKTGNDLLKEGQAMRHCVVAYKRRCMDGNTSIWSLVSNSAKHIDKRNLTIEMNNHGEIVQQRGYGNRLPRPNELAVLDRFCRDNGVRITRNSW